VVVILKAREPARILVAIGKDDRWHLEYKRRWVDQYNFYLLDRDWGRMFVRVCPYFPFSARICSVTAGAAAHAASSSLPSIVGGAAVRRTS
jgi:hypothetical protein